MRKLEARVSSKGLAEEGERRQGPPLRPGLRWIRGGVRRQGRAFGPPASLSRSGRLGRFLKEFISEERQLDGWIVVGSPEAHGPNRTEGRDGHYAIQLGFALGQFVRLPRTFPVKLDVDLKNEKLQRVEPAHRRRAADEHGLRGAQHVPARYASPRRASSGRSWTPAGGTSPSSTPSSPR